MKNYLKFFWLISVIALLGFVFTGCNEEPEDNGNGPTIITDNTMFDGLWWNSTLMNRQTNSDGIIGVWFFSYPDFWTLNVWGFAHRGTFTIEGEIDADGEATGNFIPVLTHKKDDTPPAWNWREIPEDAPPQPSRMFFHKEVDGEVLFMIGTHYFTKTSWDSNEAMSNNENPWQGMIGNAALNERIKELIPGSPVSNIILNGLWWNEDLIKNGNNNGSPGVWYLDYPNFWYLNNTGDAHKGTYSLIGVYTDGDKASAGSFTATSTMKKTGTGGWVNAGSSDVTVTAWALTSTGAPLTINTAVFQKTSWYADVNNEANNGPWHVKINDPVLTALLPPYYGWIGNEFILPPFYPQPAPSMNIINENNTSYTRNLSKPFIEGAAIAIRATSPGGDINRLMQITSNGVDSQATSLSTLLMRRAQYIILKLNDNFDGNFPTGKRIMGAVQGGNFGWSGFLWGNDSNNGNGFLMDNQGNWNIDNGAKYDAVNKMVVLEIAKALPQASRLSDYVTYPASVSGLKFGILWPGADGQTGEHPNILEYLNIKEVYLVNIVY